MCASSYFSEERQQTSRLQTVDQSLHERKHHKQSKDLISLKNILVIYFSFVLKHMSDLMSFAPVSNMSQRTLAWSMKPTDYIYLSYNPNNLTGDLLSKLYPVTKYNMGSSSGRWNNPTYNKANFMSSSLVSSCCQFSTGNGEWSSQGNNLQLQVNNISTLWNYNLCPFHKCKSDEQLLY